MGIVAMNCQANPQRMNGSFGELMDARLLCRLMPFHSWECSAEYTTHLCVQRKSIDIRQDDVLWLRNASNSSLLSTCIFPQLPEKDEYIHPSILAYPQSLIESMQVPIPGSHRV